MIQKLSYLVYFPLYRTPELVLQADLLSWAATCPCFPPMGQKPLVKELYFCDTGTTLDGE